MYIYIYIYIYTHVCMYIYIYIYVYVFIYICQCVCRTRGDLRHAQSGIRVELRHGGLAVVIKGLDHGVIVRRLLWPIREPLCLCVCEQLC